MKLELPVLVPNLEFKNRYKLQSGEDRNSENMVDPLDRRHAGSFSSGLGRDDMNLL